MDVYVSSLLVVLYRCTVGMGWLSAARRGCRGLNLLPAVFLALGGTGSIALLAFNVYELARGRSIVVLVFLVLLPLGGMALAALFLRRAPGAVEDATAIMIASSRQWAPSYASRAAPLMSPIKLAAQAGGQST